MGGGFLSIGLSVPASPRHATLGRSSPRPWRRLPGSVPDLWRQRYRRAARLPPTLFQSSRAAARHAKSNPTSAGRRGGITCEGGA